MVIAGLAGPVVAGDSVGQALTLAQAADTEAIDTEAVADMRVEDVVEQAQQYQLWIFLIASVLVIALLFAGGLLVPGGFAKAGLRDLSPMPAVVWFFAAFVVYLAVYSAATIVASTGWLEQTSFDDDQKKILIHAVGLLLGIIAGLGMLFILHRSAPEAGMKISGLDAPVGFGCFLLGYPLIALAGIAAVAMYTQINNGEQPPPIAHNTLETIIEAPRDVWWWLLIASAVIGAPFFEELVFRVFLQSALIKITKSPWISIIAASLLFAMMHRVGETPVPWHALLPILMVGITCGVGYERTKRVGVPIMMHICFNALNVVLVLLTTPGVTEATPA